MKWRPSVKLGDGPLAGVSFWVWAWAWTCFELPAMFSGSADLAACWGRDLGLGSLPASFGVEGW